MQVIFDTSTQNRSFKIGYVVKLWLFSSLKFFVLTCHKCSYLISEWSQQYGATTDYDHAWSSKIIIIIIQGWCHERSMSLWFLWSYWRRQDIKIIVLPLKTSRLSILAFTIRYREQWYLQSQGGISKDSTDFIHIKLIWNDVNIPSRPK